MNVNKIDKEYSQSEIDAIVVRIAKPIHKYFMRQIEKEVFNKCGANIRMDIFTTIVINAMATIDSNLMRLVTASNSKSANLPFDIHKLKEYFIECLNDRLKPTGKHLN